MSSDFPAGTVGSVMPSASAMSASAMSASVMSSPDHPRRPGRYAGYVGRVGALAVALGVGAGFGWMPALAYADSEGSAGATSTADSSTATGQSPRPHLGSRGRGVATAPGPTAGNRTGSAEAGPLLRSRQFEGIPGSSPTRAGDQVSRPDRQRYSDSPRLPAPTDGVGAASGHRG